MLFEPEKILTLTESGGVRRFLVREARIANAYPTLKYKNKKILHVELEFVLSDGTIEMFIREHPYADKDLTTDELIRKALVHYNLQ